MSENSNSANGSSWTLLTSEMKVSGVENVGQVAEGLNMEEQLSKAPEPSPEAHGDLEKHSSEASAHQPTETSSLLQSDPALTHGSEPPELSQVTSPETSEGRAQLNAAHVREEPSSVSSWTPDHGDQGHSQSPVSPSADGESFSDSYAHISPTSGSSPLPASVYQERDWSKSDEDSLRKTINDESKEVLETTGKEGNALRKRKISHLGSLDKTEADDDDEEGDEEDFQPPQREQETVFSLNKCILAAVILLGLGTIFFSGMLMDPDGESDMDVRELKEPTNQEWLNPEVSKDMPAGFQPPDILSKQAKEDQHVLLLQAQLQQHQVELKEAQSRAEEGEKERVRREELEKECERIKGELDRVPALQKELEQENERMKEESVRAKKELEAVPLLQRELEHLKVKVSQLTQSTESVHPIAASWTPSAGDKRDVPPIERQDTKPRKTGGKKSEGKGDQEWNKKKSGKKEDDKERKERVTEGEHAKEQKERKNDKSHQEAGKAGKRKEWEKDKERDDAKMRKESKDFKGWGEKQESKEDKKWQKDKHVGQDEKKGNEQNWKDTGNKKVKEEKEWKQRGERKENKDWKSEKPSNGNDHKEWKEKRKDEWKGEKEWRKEKSDGKHSDKTEKKWKGDKDFPKEYDGKEMEGKHWRGKQRESRDGIKEEKKKKAYNHKNEGKHSSNEKEKQHKERRGHRPPDETASHHHNDRENYWTKQRERIQHYTGQRETCSGVTDCARVEGLSPVSLRDFQTLLQSYLNKLQDQDQTSRKEELRKLVQEFFTDGVFAHDRMPFREFVEDVEDILEDMAEGEDSDSEGEGEGEESEEDDDDDEMDEFEREAMEKFSLPEEVKKVERKGEQKKDRGRVKS
ncbi:pre-B-cell leukemia transcription factor-interacting protein 1-like isoform X3 [Carassius auratus]|uniref:Pre-B-cell leukemia transcription factor-interacting protein 1-like isoform X3 n=1 Tax=Carassius auratus TaxID=7957 RepID=A0A6P6LK10_CARAU|nr:pre-B-cell leukemia transcription factor-interacting protein 1-like isoform X3 [Carassius auratus]